MKNNVIVLKIIAYAKKIISHTKGIDNFEELDKDIVLSDFCAFNLFQIGELVKNIDEPFKMKTKQIPWRSMAGLRNRIVHDYEGIDLEIIWQIVKEDLPELIEKLEKL